jgi:hypothetical protein
MLIHQYDNLTGQYIASRLADEDPRNPGRWLIPAFATTDALPARESLTWPFYIDGAWVLRPDWRGRILYRCDNGEPAEILIAGVTPEESGLTEIPRPSDKHVWGDGAWVLDPAAVAAEKHAAAMAEFERRLALARTKNAGKADAIAAGLLNDEEIYYFKAWSAYQMALVSAIEKDTFPDAVEWPPEPAPYTAQIEPTGPAPESTAASA